VEVRHPAQPKLGHFWPCYETECF